jgi:hypothetical protein
MYLDYRIRSFPKLSRWQDGNGGYAYSFKEKDKLVEYVKTQEEHHTTNTFWEEFIELQNECGIEFMNCIFFKNIQPVCIHSRPMTRILGTFAAHCPHCPRNVSESIINSIFITIRPFFPYLL